MKPGVQCQVKRQNKFENIHLSVNAVLYYAKKLPEVKAIVESFVGSEIFVTQAKVSLQKVV